MLQQNIKMSETAFENMKYAVTKEINKQNKIITNSDTEKKKKITVSQYLKYLVNVNLKKNEEMKKQGDWGTAG